MLTVSPPSCQWEMINRQLNMLVDNEAVFVITLSLLAAMVPEIASC